MPTLQKEEPAEETSYLLKNSTPKINRWRRIGGNKTPNVNPNKCTFQSFSLLSLSIAETLFLWGFFLANTTFSKEFQTWFFMYPAIGSTVKLASFILSTARFHSIVLLLIGWSIQLLFIGLLTYNAIQLGAEMQVKIPTTANLVNTVPVLITVLQMYLTYTLHQLQKQNESVKDGMELEGDQEEEIKVLRKKNMSVERLLYILRPYFWPRGFANRCRAFSTYFVLGVSKTANLIAPLYMAKATNFLLEKQQAAAIESLAVYCTLVLVSKVMKELQSVIYLKVKQTAYIEIAISTFSHIHELSLEWHLKKKMGDVLRSMDRGVESANSVVAYLFLYLIPTLVESAVVIGIFAVHFKLPTISLAAFFSLIIYSIITIKVTLWRKKFREMRMKHDNDFHDKATDSLVNFETIKIFTNEKYETQRFANSVGEYQKYDVSTQGSLSVLNSSQALIIQCAVFTVLSLASPRVITDGPNQMDIGAFVAISVYLMNLFTPLSFLGTIYNMLIKAFVDMEKLGELLSVEPDVIDHPKAKPLKGVYDLEGMSVEFRNVFFHYETQNAKAGLSNVSFTVSPGSTAAIVGHTGAGKSTIFRLLFRFYDLHQGQILVNNQDITMVTQQSLRSSIGFVPQDTVLFNESIYYNIHYGNIHSSMDEVVQAAKDACIYDFIMQLPNQWDTAVGERGLKLSGGEKQRVAIARSLLKKPQLVILDEATSALDTITENEIQKAILNLKLNKTLIVIAHRLATVRNADKIIVLKNGQVVETGTQNELLQQGGEYSKMWQVQADSSSK